MFSEMLISNCSVLIILPKSCTLIGYTSYPSPVSLATFMDNMITNTIKRSNSLQTECWNVENGVGMC